MSQKFFTRLTQIGQAKYANAVGVGEQINFVQLVVGDGGGQELTPEQVQQRESMVNQVRVGPINQVYKDADNPNWLVMEQILPPEVGGWTIREVGIIDDAGDLVAYGNYPSTYKPILEEGSSRTSTVRFVLMVSDTSAITLKVDPSVVLATRKYADDAIAAHAGSRNHPAGTTTAQGMLQLATSDQTRDGTATNRATHPAGVKAAIDIRIADQSTVDAGTDDVKFVTAKKLKAWAAAWVKAATETVAGMLKVATQAQVNSGTDDATAVTPKKLRWGVEYSAGTSGYLFLPSWLGGVGLQWGAVAINGSQWVNFPTSFPTRCVSVCIGRISNPSSFVEYAQVLSYEAHRFQVIGYDDVGGRSVGAMTISFFTIGH